jgi:predicted O-methyltransferase YrrM
MEVSLAVKLIFYKLFSGHRKGFGIHSPFVFDLVSRIFRNKIDSVIVNSVEAARKRMLSDQGIIKVEDLGSGSRRMTDKERRICDIAKYSAVPRKYGVFLYRMAGAFGRPLIVELGTSLGISTMYMAAASPEVPLITIEGSATVSEIASMNFTWAGLQNIRSLTGSFESLLPAVKKEGIHPGLVFIDGDHRREPLLSCFNHIADMSGPDTVVIIDDINYGKDMAATWKTIQDHQKVSVTVDIFRMGVVFFRKGIAKANYVVRY